MGVLACKHFTKNKKTGEDHQGSDRVLETSMFIERGTREEISSDLETDGEPSDLEELKTKEGRAIRSLSSMPLVAPW